MSASNIQFFFQMRDQMKLYHWQTDSFSRHKATDGTIEKLDALIDRYVEVYIGKYGRPKMTSQNSIVKVQHMSDSTAVRFVRNCIEYVSKDLIVNNRKLSDTDLTTIRDEMLAELNQLLYLFTLD